MMFMARLQFIGYFVDLDEANICRLFTRIEPLIAQKVHIPLANHFAAFLMWKLSLILVRNPGRISDNR
jgi:hypothetical protein